MTTPHMARPPDRPSVGHYAPARDHCLAPSRASDSSSPDTGQYGRLFPYLETCDCAEDVIFALGRAGGLADPRVHAHPAGEAVALAIGVEPRSSAQTGLDVVGWSGETPLWCYVLKEANAYSHGERLGPVGDRSVAEVVLGIIDRDPESYRAVDPSWRPSLPQSGSVFGLGDLLAFADRARSREITQQ